MEKTKANILLIGNSGAGKSTLINAILEEDIANTSLGERGTDKMDIYDGEAFRLIDSKGMEYNTLSQMSAKRQIKSWMRKNLDENHQDKCVHMLWYCVDATAARFSEDNLKVLKTVTKFWKDIPVVVVITKSYSEIQRTEYEEMILKKIKESGKGKINVKAVISVVAKEMPINDSVIIPTFGLDKLVDKTIELIPEALKMSKNAIYKYTLQLKRKMAQSLVATTTAASGAIGAAPIPVADAMVLVPAQSAMIYGIGRIYGISQKDSDVINTIVEGCTISMPARAAVSSLKATFPGVGNAINAIVASVITAALGEVVIAVMDNIYTGKIKKDDLDWIRKFTESEFKKTIDKKIPALKDLDKLNLKDLKSIGESVAKIFQKKK